MSLAKLRSAVLEWYRPRRHAYAWRRGRRSPYRTLVSEVMLQQTQAARVEPIFEALHRPVPRRRRTRRSLARRRPPCLGGSRVQPPRGRPPRGRARRRSRTRRPGAEGRGCSSSSSRRRPVHRRRRGIDRLRRARRGGRYQRPEDHRASDPRSRVGRGGVRSARSRRAGLARPIGPGGLEPIVDGSRPRLLPAGAALRRLPARVPLSVPCRRPDAEAVRPAAVRRSRGALARCAVRWSGRSAQSALRPPRHSPIARAIRPVRSPPPPSPL